MLSVNAACASAFSLRIVISKKTGHECFLILRLQDDFSVTLHLGCFRKLVLGVVPATLGIVSVLVAEGAREDGDSDRRPWAR